MGPIVFTQLATGLSMLAGAVLVKQVMDQKTMFGPGRIPQCPSCNGTGRIFCICSRWSDGDVAAELVLDPVACCVVAAEVLALVAPSRFSSLFVHGTGLPEPKK